MQSTKIEEKSTDQLKKNLRTIEENKYFQKYKGKLKEVLKVDSEKFHKKLDDRLKENKWGKPLEESKDIQKHIQTNLIGMKNKNLSDGSSSTTSLFNIMKEETLKDLTKEDIIHLWHEFYKNKRTISGAFDGNVYREMKSIANHFPLMLLPLPNENGIEFYICQWNNDIFYLTSLINYQAHGQNSPIKMIFRHYDELMETHNLVLMKGDMLEENFTTVEGHLMARTIKLLYASHDAEEKMVGQSLVKEFNEKSDSFKYQKLIEFCMKSKDLYPKSIVKKYKK
ncbi:hypothetical protein SNEBB_003649 [Seison nebaliae]|nr:hypothetical protein SNEBB_003649 [Seison nebaliae]